jgi:SulP family sulfate permease
LLVPKLFSTLRGYNRQQFLADATAGVIVGVVALPLAIAFAIASGVAPQAGLYTAIVAGFLVSALGGSRVQIGGPTGAFVVIVYGIVQQHGFAGLAVATLLAGCILIALGLARLGGTIKFVPFPLTIGFTSGIALIIFSGQVKDLFGLPMGAVPVDFVAKWTAYAQHASAFRPWAAAVAALTLAILLQWPRFGTRVPGPFVALVVVTTITQLAHLPVETIGGRFGEIHAALPMPSWPITAEWLRPERLRAIFPSAVAIALLGGIESLLSAVVADGMIGGRHRSNMELVAQGVANIVSPLFGGIPATGAIARTATNVKNGGRTPVAGIVHAITLLLITLFFGRWAAMIPMAVLGAILVVVAYHMSEWRTFVAEFRAPRSDVIVMLATFLLTVLVDLVLALEVGMVLAAFLFMKRMAEVTNVSAVTRELEEEGDDYDTDLNAVRRRSVPAGVEVYEINGPFFFGAAETFRDTMQSVAAQPKVLILRLRNVPAIDSTALNVLRDLVHRGRKTGTMVLLSDVHAQPMLALGRSYLLDEIGDDNIFGNVDDALNRARTHLGLATQPRPPFAIPTVARETPAEGVPIPPEARTL